MAASIIIEQSKETMALDKTPKAEKTKNNVTREAIRKKPETKEERIVRRKIVRPDGHTVSEIRRTSIGDPYAGHGVVPVACRNHGKAQSSKKRKPNGKRRLRRMQERAEKRSARGSAINRPGMPRRKV